MKFVPEVVTVKKGDSVTWVNKDFFPHTATASKAPDGKSFDSKEIKAEGTWKYSATQTGSYDYSCTLHPNMKGRLVVE
jgi:plastocyanin